MSQIRLSSQEIGALIFDMNGTIINDGQYHHEAFRIFIERHKLGLTYEQYHGRVNGRTNAEIMSHLFGREVSPEELAGFEKEKEEIYHHLYAPHIKEVAGFTNLVTEAKRRGLKVGMATASPQMNVDFTFSHLPIGEFFDSITLSSEVLNPKPAPDIYLKTAEKLGIDYGRCVVFEDTPSGTAAGKAAGMLTIGVLTEYQPESLPAADQCVTAFTEVSIS
jgi:beta-phosphoglucomutase